MAAINKIGFDYEAMEQNGEDYWESPEDIISYVRAGLNYLNKTNGSDNPEVIEKRNRWIELSKQTFDCLEILE